MKKLIPTTRKIIWLSLLFLAAINLSAQSIYYDAIYIQKHLIPDNNGYLIIKENKFTKFKSEELTKKKNDNDKLISDLEDEMSLGGDDRKIDSLKSKIKSEKLKANELKAERESFDKAIVIENDTVYTILKRYFPEIDLSNTPADNQKIIDKNPFFAKLKIKFSGDAKSSNGITGNLNLAGIATGLGGLDVTAVADGLARFMVKRAKQELTINFFSKFKEEMERDELSDLHILFPTTYKTLKAIDSDIYQYNAYITTLRESFQKDLAQIHTNLPQVWLQEKYIEFFKNHPEAKFVLDNSNIISNSLLNNIHPGDVITKIANNPYGGSDVFLSNFSTSIKVLDLFSQAFRDTSANRYWVTSNHVLELTNDKILRTIFLGLVYQESINKKIEFIDKNKNKVKFAEDVLGLIAKNEPEIEQYISYLTALVTKGEAIDSKLNEIKEKKKNNIPIDYDDYYSVVNISLDLFDQALKVDELPHFKDKLKDHQWPRYCKSFVPIGKLINETALDITKKNYSSAILNTGILVDSVFNLLDIEGEKLKVLKDWKENKIKIADIAKEVKKINTKEDPNKKNSSAPLVKKLKIIEKYLGLSADDNRKVNEWIKKLEKTRLTDAEFKAINDLLPSDKEFLLFKIPTNSYFADLIKYGTFAASLATAENAEQAEQIIENMALPAGSARIKKHMAFSVSLNSYLGGFVGTNNFKAGNTSMGVSGLVGVGLNWGYKPKGTKYPWAFSIFANVIDVGALAAFRINNDTTDYKFKIKAAQILSPGGFFVVAIPKVPLSFMLGYQYAPLARKIQNSATLIEYERDRGRLTFAIVVDIPLMHFYNQTRKN